MEEERRKPKEKSNASGIFKYKGTCIVSRRKSEAKLMEVQRRLPQTLNQLVSCYEEEEEEQKGNETVKRKRKRSSDNSVSLSSWLPHDLIEEILERLPVGPLLRFEFVSKQWESTIKSREFVERHKIRQKSRDPTILHVLNHVHINGPGPNHPLLCFNTTELESGIANIPQRYTFPTRYRGPVEVSESCDGLVCIYGWTTLVHVVNPAMACLWEFPKARFQCLLKKRNLDDEDHYGPFSRLGFGKDNVTGAYKAVWLYNCNKLGMDGLTKCEILDLRREAWRYTKAAPYRIFDDQTPAYVNGLLYWFTDEQQQENNGVDEETGTKVLALDLHTEKFRVIPNPIAQTPPHQTGMCSLNERLCISKRTGDSIQEFWVMNSDNNMRWEKKFSLNLQCVSSWFGDGTQPITPVAVSQKKNILLTHRYTHNLVMYDTTENSYSLFSPKYNYGLVVPYFPSLVSCD